MKSNQNIAQIKKKIMLTLKKKNQRPGTGLGAERLSFDICLAFIGDVCVG